MINSIQTCLHFVLLKLFLNRSHTKIMNIQRCNVMLYILVFARIHNRVMVFFFFLVES